MIKLPFIRSWCNLWIESYKLISMTNDCQIFYSHLFCRARKILLLSEDNEFFFDFVPYAVSEIGKERAASLLEAARANYPEAFLTRDRMQIDIPYVD